MAKVKGCVNAKCVANKGKITYSESEEFCSKCGQPLSYVCKKCYKPLESAGKYCVMHQAEKDDRTDKRKKVVFSIGGAVLAAGTLLLAKGKDIAKHFPKK